MATISAGKVNDSAVSASLSCSSDAGSRKSPYAFGQFAFSQPSTLVSPSIFKNSLTHGSASIAVSLALQREHESPLRRLGRRLSLVSKQ